MTLFKHPVTGQIQTAQSKPVERFLRSRGYEPHTAVGDPGGLKGAALDAELEVAGLSKSGSADEKRARLVEHLAVEPDVHVDAPPTDPSQKQ